MSIQVLNPGTGQFVLADQGQVSNETLLLNILVELRVISQFLQAQNPQIADDLSSLRADQVTDPISIATNNAQLKK